MGRKVGGFRVLWSHLRPSRYKSGHISLSSRPQWLLISLRIKLKLFILTYSWVTCYPIIIISSTPFGLQCVLVWMINYVVTLSSSRLCMFPISVLRLLSSVLLVHIPPSSQTEGSLKGPMPQDPTGNTLLHSLPLLVLLSSQVSFRCSFFRGVFLYLFPQGL